VWQIVQDPSGTIFLTTREGAYILQDGKWESLGPTLPLNPFSALKTAEGEVWVFYFDRAVLTRHRREGGVWKREEEWHPFPGKERMSILANALAPDGSLWIGTTSGLGRLDPKQRRVAAWFAPGEGIPSADANNHALILEGNGDLWYGTTEGVGRFREAGSRVLAAPPQPILLEWNAGNRLFPLQEALPLLKPGEVLQAHFALNAFDSPLGLFLEARLLGVDPDWVRLSEHRGRYAGLAPGSYRLEVRGNRIVDQPGTPLVLTFRVLPRWWQTWWAMFLGACSLGLGALAAVSLRHRAILRHNLELKGLVAEQTEELKQTNQMLEEASQHKSLFLASMSHELRTPLNAILLYTELLAGEAEDEQELERSADLRKVSGAGQHLLSLINRILDLSQIEAGAVSLELADQDIDVLLQEVAEILRPLAGQKGNRLDLDLPEGQRLFRTDATKLRQVLLNLGGNACKFTTGGTISLKADLSSDRLRLEVRDTGKGMTPEEITRIFGAFEQANNEIRKRYGGTGLGLTISRKLVELMGGSIQVSSVLGEGSVFVVELPN
jgi:signal transduction histidine kinase